MYIDISFCCRVLTFFFSLVFQVQELGLQTSYSRDQGTHTWIREIMALPFLPEDQISRAFRKLKRKAATRPLQELAEYVENTWITSTTWPPASWSVYLQAVRTNNDVEGWHYGLNRRAQGKSQLPFYMLIMLLHEESRLTWGGHGDLRFCGVDVFLLRWCGE